jgi:hypothetical protein
MENLENDLKTLNNEIIHGAMEEMKEQKKKGRPSNKDKKIISLKKEDLEKLNISYNQIKKILPKKPMSDKQKESLLRAQETRKNNIMLMKQKKEEDKKEMMKDKININIKHNKPRQKKEKEMSDDEEGTSDYNSSEEDEKPKRRPSYEKKKPKIKEQLDSNLEALKKIDDALTNSNPYLKRILELRGKK